ncbi:MAG: hypothetical protein M9949_09095 [Candidatus Kapabacteria bacterium]|nr:hypothetical protein [Candidatus Kapabacteria bacterium]
MKISSKDISKKNLFLIASFTIVLLLSSCNFLYKFTPAYWKLKSEFKKEREFVQKILDNPDKMQEIIETSEFYDKGGFNMTGYTYKEFIDYIKKNKDGNEAEIIWFGRTSLSDGKGKILYENAKGVSIYQTGRYNRLVFVFFELENKIILAEISSVTR